jgi:hypothetical protein
MTCARLMMFALALAATAIECEPALAWRNTRPHRPLLDYRNHLPYRDRILLLPPPGIINGNNAFPETNGSLLPVVPPYEPQTAPGPFYPNQAPSLPQGMVITVNKFLSDKTKPDDQQSSAPINRPKQAAEQLATCWKPPLPDRGNTVEVTLRFGFDSKGDVLWPPRITYVKAEQGLSADDVRKSILDAFKACTPLHFSSSMAANMPGYPLSVRFIGRRADEPGQAH